MLNTSHAAARRSALTAGLATILFFITIGASKADCPAPSSLGG